MSDTAPTPFPAAWPPSGLGRTRDLLIARPELVRSDAALMQALGVRPIAANVVDFGPAALARLERAVAVESEARQEMEAIARANYEAQAQTHAAVLHLLEARSNADLARRLEDAAEARFGLAAAVLAAEGEAPAGWRRLEAGEAERLCPGPRGLWLGPAEALGEVFGPEAGVASAVLVRLSLWRGGAEGILALGAADPDTFGPEMGAELVVFLARTIERTADRWPPVL